MAGTYKQEISATKNLPACLIVLLDQSGSMAEQFGADNINPKNPENPWLWVLYRLGMLSEA